MPTLCRVGTLNIKQHIVKARHAPFQAVKFNHIPPQEEEKEEKAKTTDFFKFKNTHFSLLLFSL